MNISKDQLEKDIEIILNKTDKNEKLAWARKNKKMKGLLEKLIPIEEEILELINSKNPILNEISELREIMVRECVHPVDMLIRYADHIQCKFCNIKIIINRNLNDKI